jgi:hypothetical protein
LLDTYRWAKCNKSHDAINDVSEIIGIVMYPKVVKYVSEHDTLLAGEQVVAAYGKSGSDT